MKSIINRRRACGNSGSNEIVFVEYVDNLSGSYIDTGVSIESESYIDYEIRFALRTNPSTNDKYAIFGAESSGIGLYIYCYKSKALQAINKYGNQSSNFAVTQKVNSINTIKCQGKVLTVNGNVTDDFSRVTSFSTGSIYLFNINTENHTEDYSVAPMRFFKAYLSVGQRNPTTLFDLTPCRIGNAGYIYDSINNRLLGDGRFVPGPDLEPKI